MSHYPTPIYNRKAVHPFSDIPAVAVSDPAGSTSLDTKESSATKERRSGKHKLVTLLTEAGLPQVADKVRACSEEFLVLRCLNSHVHGPIIPTFVCGHRLCRDCGRRRQNKALARLKPAFKALHRLYPFDRFVFLTLTVRSSHDDLRDIIRRFNESFRRFRRTKLWKDSVRAAVAGFEVTYSPEEGVHYHCHLVICRKRWWEQKEISETWKAATRGEGYIVHIEEITNLEKGLVEATKYCFDPSDLKDFTPGLVRQFTELKGIKFSETYGALRGLKVEDDDGDLDEPQLQVGDLCPDCGEKLSSVIYSRLLVNALIEENERERKKSCHGPPDG